MQVVFVVLHKTELLQNLLTSLKKHNTGIAFAMPITKVAGVVKDDSLF